MDDSFHLRYLEVYFRADNLFEIYLHVMCVRAFTCVFDHVCVCMWSTIRMKACVLIRVCVCSSDRSI